jgi:hypothetical protein
MKFITHNNLRELLLARDKSFDGSAVAIGNVFEEGRVCLDFPIHWKDECPRGTVAVVLCNGTAIWVKKSTKFLIVLGKEIK